MRCGRPGSSTQRTLTPQCAQSTQCFPDLAGPGWRHPPGAEQGGGCRRGRPSLSWSSLRGGGLPPPVVVRPALRGALGVRVRRCSAGRGLRRRAAAPPFPHVAPPPAHVTRHCPSRAFTWYPRRGGRWPAGVSVRVPRSLPPGSAGAPRLREAAPSPPPPPPSPPVPPPPSPGIPPPPAGTGPAGTRRGIGARPGGWGRPGRDWAGVGGWGVKETAEGGLRG